MCCRKMLSVLVPFLWLTPALAQSPAATAPADQPSFSAEQMRPYLPLVQERLKFARRMYGLDLEHVGELLRSMSVLVPAHADYMQRQAQTLRLRKAALRIARQKRDVSDAIRAKVVAKFENEIADIQAQAPLSLSSVARLAEERLTKEQVAAGRRAIAQEYASVLKGGALEIDELDRLAFLKEQETLAAASFEEQERILKQRIKAEQQARAAQAKTPPPPSQPPAVKAPPARTAAAKPAKPVPPAPPLKTWPGLVDQAAKKYQFTADQKRAAERVLRSCRKRAEAHLEKNKAAYEAAEKLSDAERKQKRLQMLNKPLDKLYDELGQRVESIASVEQKQTLVRKASKKTPTEQ